jgi:CelD/BcsL family acetyltransferase involved in cellulose biosynthesis
MTTDRPGGVAEALAHAAAAHSAGLRCRVLTDADDWQAVRAWWDALLARSEDPTPWQGWDYLSRWWRHLGEGKELRLLVVERDGEPVLALPLQISRRFEMIGLPVRMLEPVAMIMDVNRPRLGLGRFDPEAYHCAFETLWRRRGDWDVIRVDEKTAGDAEVALLREFAARHGLWYRAIFSHVCPWLDLRQDFDAYLRSRGSKLRKNLRAARRRLEAMGEVEIRTYDSPAGIREGFGLVLGLHRESWKRRERVEHSQSAAYQAFYAGWLDSLAARGCARILVLSCGGRPAAATIAVMRGDTYHSAQIVHDERFRAASPGTLLESMELAGLMREGRYATYDFLGAFLNNKLRWTDTVRATDLVFVFRPSLRTALIDAWYFRVKPLAKSVLRRIGVRLPNHGAPLPGKPRPAP